MAESENLQLHRQIVQQALGANVTCPNPQPDFLFGELILYHTFVQDFGHVYLEEEQIIPILERSKKRIEKGPLQ